MTDISYITKQKFSEIINIDYKDINTKRFNQKIYNKLNRIYKHNCLKATRYTICKGNDTNNQYRKFN